MQSNDRQLLEGCLRRDSKAQAALYHQYKGRFFGICRRYAKNREDAEDLLQDAFVKIFLNLNELKSAEQMSAWIRRVVVNVCIDYYHKKVNFTNIDEIHDIPTKDWETDDVISQMSNMELLTAVNELPDGARMVFNLFVIDGFSHQEISEMLNITEGTSKSQLFFAKKILRKKLEKIGIRA
ncbi:RNA polymerase, sigma-24 subunit, ECF subfamily [Emticicia oligotrophica DSM 17448]|uniref:RNA polymerase sigma factor n=1 Tax=Emticicia oligotrophica (strain DSM 17448 / CIP 109782 / MTCC 6937 / GPTSA100-15) TaxID=929562 RepID=A0ABM5MWU2_EMTOG|nr:RNA polymerase sigma factor [Emticicia oligotrophica]AFK01638.1 RNA polymerase, sigma-24 subunit, ECF subfamily [Emticicia oligotrophica DSM 17448]